MSHPAGAPTRVPVSVPRDPELVGVWRYPVKSMGGERLRAATVEVGSGVGGDRRWAVVDPVSRTVITAKRDPRILYLWATTRDDGEVAIGVPGLPAPVPIGDAEPAVSAWLGRRISLVRWQDAQPRDSFDFGFPLDRSAHSFGDCGDVLHLIGTGTLRWFAQLDDPVMSTDEAIARVRPNLVVDTGDEPFTEDAWLGHELSFGAVVVQVREPTTRCQIVERPQPGRPARETVLDTLTERRSGRLGVYVVVRTAGRLAPGVSRGDR